MGKFYFLGFVIFAVFVVCLGSSSLIPLCLSIKSNILFNWLLLMNPAIEAFLSALISWNTMKGTTMTSLSQAVPAKPFLLLKLLLKFQPKQLYFLIH